jgi:hypothetical protein
MGQQLLDHLGIKNEEMNLVEHVGDDDIVLVVAMAVVVEGVSFLFVILVPLHVDRRTSQIMRQFQNIIALPAEELGVEGLHLHGLDEEGVS